MRRAVPVFMLLIGLTVGFFVARSVLRPIPEPPALKAEEERAAPVRTRPLEFGPRRHTLSFTGKTISPQEATLAFEVTGTIQAIHKREGAPVAAGDVIAELDDRLFALRESEAQAHLEIARNEHDAARDLPSTSRVRLRNLAATVRAMEAASDAATISREKCVLKAPFDGLVTAREVEVGATSTPGISCFRVSSVDPIRVQVGVPEHLIPMLREGQAAEVTVDPYPNDPPRAGTVRLVARAPFPNTLLFPIEIELPNDEGKLYLGMVARCEIVVGVFERAATIPLSATFVNAGKRMVFIVRDGRAVKIPLTGFHGRGSELIVTQAALDGAELVVEGHRLLLDGARIRTVE